MDTSERAVYLVGVYSVRQRHPRNRCAFSWRRQYLQGLLSQRNTEPVRLLPVHVSEAQASKVNRSDRRQVTAAVSGTIQVEFPKGHVCVTGGVDGEALRIVLEHLLR